MSDHNFIEPSRNEQYDILTVNKIISKDTKGQVCMQDVVFNDYIHIFHWSGFIFTEFKCKSYIKIKYQELK